MNAGKTHPGIGTRASNWLRAGRRTSWRSKRSRWLQAGLTAALVLAGLATWALAIVQPWKVQPVDPGIVPIKDLLSPDRVRDLAKATDERVGPAVVCAVRPVTRNPFQGAGAAPAAMQPARTPVLEAGDEPAETWTAGRVAEVAQALSFKATVSSPGGERLAVINGKTYREGDDVAGLTLVEIQEDQARLQRADIQCILTMD